MVNWGTIQPHEMITVPTRLLLLAPLLLLHPSLAAADDLADELRECRAIPGDNVRLACYDALQAPEEVAAADPVAATVEADVVAAAPVATAAVAATAATATATQATDADGPQPLTDEVAKGNVKDQSDERPEYAATVTSCTKSKSSHRLYFHMENGQIWRQSNSGRLKLSDNSCQFDVVLRKDGFGWVMLIPSDKNRKIRVRRQQ